MQQAWKLNAQRERGRETEQESERALTHKKPALMNTNA